jgi:hypothetical protein
MLCVLYKKRALPIAWLVAKGSKGHFCEADHLRLLQQVAELIPEDTDVMFLGDGEFDGVDLLRMIDEYGWHYVCRTAKDSLLTHANGSIDNESISFDQVPLVRGTRQTLLDVGFTREQYPVSQAIAWWDAAYDEPIYLLSNLDAEEDPCHWYAKRFTVETLFSDHKSRGFHLHKSHLSQPDRLATLMIAVCLGYVWMIYLGIWAVSHDWQSYLHRKRRCDLSLFQLGLRMLEQCLNDTLVIPVAFGVRL